MTDPTVNGVNGNSTHLNGTTSSSPGGHGPGGRYSPEAWAEFRDLAANAMSARQDWLRNLSDPRRDIEDSCGYPTLNTMVSVDLYRQLYDRDAIAARVVELMPKESWQVQPMIYEDEESEPTKFEKAWDELGGSLFGGGTWFKQEQGSVVWEYLQRVDILSGIGQFGVVLIGIDDGLPLHAPTGGTMIVHRKTEMVANADGGISHAKIEPIRVPMIEDSPITNEQVIALRALKDLNPEEELAINQMVEHREYKKRRREEEAKKAAKRQTDLVDDQVRQGQPVGNAGGFTGEGKQRPPYTPKETPSTKAKTSDGKPLFATESPGFVDSSSSSTDIMGTDQQYFGVQYGQSEAFSDAPSKVKNSLLFLRAFDEPLVQVVRYEWNVRNPRFGMPVMYRITLNDPRYAHSGVGLPLATVFVHWSRVIHVADNLGSSEIFGRPRQQQVLNNILGLRKIYCGSPEMYWRGAFPGLAISTHPTLGGDVIVDKDKVRDSMENYFNDLQRYLLLSGMDAKTLAPTTVDPGPHIEPQLEAICVILGVPLKKFKGSEGKGKGGITQGGGESEDGDWNDKIRNRQNTYLTPRLVVPFVDRMIQVGVLPEPKQYLVEWPDLNAVDDGKLASTALAKTQALGAYVSQGVEAVMAPLDYLVDILGMEDEKAQQIIDSAAQAQQEAQAEADKQQEEMQAEQDQAMQDHLDQQADATEEGGPPAPPPTMPVKTAASSMPGKHPEVPTSAPPPVTPPPAPGSDGSGKDGSSGGKEDDVKGATFKIVPTKNSREELEATLNENIDQVARTYNLNQEQRDELRAQWLAGRP
jgi:hypothetical protein